MKFIVTGGAGFIGSHVCEALLERGDYVICIDNFNDYYNPNIKRRNIKNFLKNSSFKLFRSDITNFFSMENIFKKEKPDKIIHLAARAGVRPSIQNPLLYTRVNVDGTVNLLELSRQYKIKNFIFASSSSVYGEREKIPFNEEDVLNPISPYAATKVADEVLCRAYSNIYEIPITCLRFFTVYGPRGRPDMAPYKFMNSMINNKTIEMYGDGSSARDYTYIADITKGVIAAVDNNLSYGIINLGNSHPVKLKDFISIMENIVGKKAKIKKMPRQQGDVSRTYADISKARKLLGWEPNISLEEGLKKTYQYMLKQRY